MNPEKLAADAARPPVERMTREHVEELSHDIALLNEKMLTGVGSLRRLREILRVVESLESRETVNVPTKELEWLANYLDRKTMYDISGRMRGWLTPKGQAEGNKT